MYLYGFLIITIVVHCASVRISSKLDFGEPASASHGAIKVNQGPRPNFGNPSTVREVSCDSNDCNISKNSDSASATADVVVQVKTHVNVPNAQNQTRAENVPDVPVIVGTKEAPPHIPFDSNPVFTPNFQPDYEHPGVGFNVVNRNPLPLERGFINYAPNNEVPFNHHYVPELEWYPQPNQNDGYNPVEFTKIYKNTWTSNFPNDWSGYTNKRHTHSDSCSCNNPQKAGVNADLSKWNQLLGINNNRN